jgi:uncharacterized membrane protein YeaQ/YmgE (transglycosylase-associated protein family)
VDLIVFILLALLNGLIVGGLARLLLPGEDPMSIWTTIAIGIAGSFIGGLISYYALGEDEWLANLAISLAVAVGLVYLFRRSRATDAPARP